jgi:hypothetical protein
MRIIYLADRPVMPEDLPASPSSAPARAAPEIWLSSVGSGLGSITDDASPGCCPSKRALAIVAALDPHHGSKPRNPRRPTPACKGRLAL